MAERTVIVCDSCGEIAAERVSIRAGGRALQKDLCATHLAELLRGANPARRGRPPAAMTGMATPTATAPKRRGRPAKAATAAAAGGRRRGRRAGAAASAAAASTPKAARPRRKITDPAILEKRRAALAKARQALAAKRAAANA